MKRSLPFTKEIIEKTAAKYPTPFYVYDEEGIRSTVKALQRAFSWNSGYREYFAVKALPNPAILKFLHSLGCGADCASETELMLCERIGITGRSIMFSSNETPAADYEYARRLGAYINLDDSTHVDFLREHGGIPETICLRYNPGKFAVEAGSIMGSLYDSKYGMTKDQLKASVRKLAEYGAKSFGLHAFLKSCSLENEYYPALAAELFELAAELHREFGADIAFINLSGGLGIPYRPEENGLDLEAVGEGVRKQYERVFDPLGVSPAIFTECGRFVTGPHGYLITRIIHEKNTYRHYAGTDSCAVDLMRPAMYGAYHHIAVLGKEDEPAEEIYDVVGSLCENNDKFAVQRPLPRLQIGDVIAICDAGAHGSAMGYNYNGRLHCAELLMHRDKSVSLIRRAQTPADYFSTLDIYPEFSR